MGDDSSARTRLASRPGIAAVRPRSEAPLPPRTVLAPRHGSALHDGDAEWEARVDRLRAHLGATGRPPRDASGAPDAERATARWVKRQRELLRTGALAERRLRHLDSVVPGWRDPRGTEWHGTAVAVGLHLAETGAYPAPSADDEVERRLATWLRTQRRAEASGRLAPDRLAWLELNLPSWRRPADEDWGDTVAAIAGFIAETGRFPRETANDEPGERRLAGWLRRQREAAADERLDDERRRALDDAVPGWLDPAAARWTRTARRLAGWTAAHGRPPSKHAADPVERRLGEWLAGQRRLAAAGSLPETRTARLDRSVPGWRERPDAAWRARLEELTAFVAEAGRAPARSNDAGDDERRAAAWLAEQRTAARAGRLSEARRTLLDRAVVGWFDDERDWRMQADRLARRLATGGKIPASHADDSEERALARWLQRQRSLAGSGGLDESRERWLDRQLPGWRDHRLTAWEHTANRLQAFRTEHGRLPARGADATAQELELGVWLNNQRSAARRGGLSAERERWLDSRIPEWRDPHLASWLRRAAEVADYLAERGRLPYERSTVERSRRLGTWLQTQRRAHRGGTLDAIRIAWLDVNTPGWAGEGSGPRPVPPSEPATPQRASTARRLGEDDELPRIA
ncbi:helicase associated domain-containing protein [Agromyces mediolanus]|uniref:helicase associated domain-containing protein n=1 Tax=Agromyces mediolanus TaxID=41986 RepID=UPI0020407434|nr:helicase associated domain-containing protein [Agromyces mediolanus]MCM3657521.1 helicase associated domain-containing protein [Agromyces mediolanus]